MSLIFAFSILCAQSIGLRLHPHCTCRFIFACFNLVTFVKHQQLTNKSHSNQVRSGAVVLWYVSSMLLRALYPDCLHATSTIHDVVRLSRYQTIEVENRNSKRHCAVTVFPLWLWKRRV